MFKNIFKCGEYNPLQNISQEYSMHCTSTNFHNQQCKHFPISFRLNHFACNIIFQPVTKALILYVHLFHTSFYKPCEFKKLDKKNKTP